MIELLKDKKGIFFDVGYILNYPASGDWMFTKKMMDMNNYIAYQDIKSKSLCSALYYVT